MWNCVRKNKTEQQYVLHLYTRKSRYEHLVTKLKGYETNVWRTHECHIWILPYFVLPGDTFPMPMVTTICSNWPCSVFKHILAVLTKILENSSNNLSS